MIRPIDIIQQAAEKEKERQALIEKMSSHESELKELEVRLRELDILYEREKLALEMKAAKQVVATKDTISELRDQVEELRQETAKLKTQSPAQNENPVKEEKRVQELEAFLAEKDKHLSEERKKWLTRDQETKAEFALMIEDLARGYAHRVRNHLGTISGTAQICIARHKIEEETKEQLRIIDQGVSDMLETTEEFLKMTKSREMLYEQIDLPRMLQALLAAIQPALQGQAITVHTDFAPDAPAVTGVPALVEEALRNILQNAVEAMAKGGNLDVSVHHDRAAKHVLAIISDTGIGIGEQHLKKVFQPYFTSKKQHKGNGLTVARILTDLQGGSITLQSTKGKGTTIQVHFPL